MEKKKIICHDRNKKDYEIDADKLTFRPSVYGILIEEDHILLSKQWDGYDLPGGGVKIEETLEQALEREFFEETGLTVKLITPVYCGTSFFHPIRSEKNQDQFWNCLVIYFLVKKVGGAISKDNIDEEEKEYLDLPEWIDINSLGKIKFYNSIDNKSVIDQAVVLLNKLYG